MGSSLGDPSSSTDGLVTLAIDLPLGVSGFPLPSLPSRLCQHDWPRDGRVVRTPVPQSLDAFAGYVPEVAWLGRKMLRREGTPAPILMAASEELNFLLKWKIQSVALKF